MFENKAMVAQLMAGSLVLILVVMECLRIYQYATKH